MTMRAEAPREDLRQWLQLVAAAGALGLRWIDAAQAILACTVLLLFVLIVVPRIGQSLYRPEESREGAPLGLLLYPVTLLLLVVIFWSLGGKPQVTASIWGLFACGDGAATVIGSTWGGRLPLPWNPRKSWPGSIAYLVCGSVVGYFLYAWVGSRGDTDPEGGVWLVWGICCAVAALCAFLESLPVHRFNDNFWVPLVGAVVMYTALLVRIEHMQANLPEPVGYYIELGVLAILAFWTWRQGSLSLGGFGLVLLVGALMLLFLGPAGALAMVVLVVVVRRAIRYGQKRRLVLDLADPEASSHLRTGRILAGSATPLFLAFLAFSTGAADQPDSLHGVFSTACLGALAGAVAAVLGRELGPVFGRTAILATTLRRVAVGTRGAISLQGTLLGAAGALALGLVGAACGLVAPWGIPMVCVAGAAGSYLASFIVASLSSAQRLGSELLLLINTTAGGSTVILLHMLFP